MYTVYLLYFDSSERGYIGITRNFKHRLRQHKHEALRIGENLKARWMRKHLEQGETVRVLILAENKTKDEAVWLEKHFIRAAPFALANLTEGGETCSPRAIAAIQRASRRLAKEYVLIKDGQLEVIKGLSTICRERGLSHGNLHNALKGKIRHAQGYLVFFKDAWDAMTDAERQEVLDSYRDTVAVRIPAQQPNSWKAVQLTDGRETRTFESVTALRAHLDCSYGVIYKSLNSEYKVKGKYSISYL